MKKGLGRLFVLLALMAANAVAQDAISILQAAAKEMGSAKLESVQYSGTGYGANFGQSYDLDMNWPRFEIARYTKTIDYDAECSEEELISRQGSYPAQGGGMPLQGEQRQTNLFSGNYAWSVK